MTPIHPILLAGPDAGGFWPVARRAAPSWLQPLIAGRSPFQTTATALADADQFEPPIVVAPSDDRFRVAQQLADLELPHAGLLLLPSDRGPLAAAAGAIARLKTTTPDALALLAPAHQAVRRQDRAAFRRAVAAAASEAAAGDVVRFAAPARPWLGSRPEMATGLVDAGWTLAPVNLLAELIESATPDLWAAASAAAAMAVIDLDFLRLDPEAYGMAPDLGLARLFEAATDRTNLHALEFAPVAAEGWEELRAALADRSDAEGNVTAGDALIFDANRCFIDAGERLTVVAGAEDLAVVVTDDAVLVANLQRPHALADALARIDADGREEAIAHPMEHRPWGDFKRLAMGPRYQVKRIRVKPGGSTSLQKHHHRSEHWVVVAGTAEVTVDGETRMLRENESAYLPLGSAHRLANPGKIELELVEVQSGAYLGEDDIIRLDDPYKREDD